MKTTLKTNSTICIEVAGLAYCLDNSQVKANLTFPPAHQKFILTKAPEAVLSIDKSRSIKLVFKDKKDCVSDPNQTIITRSDFWQFAVNDQQEYALDAFGAYPPTKLIFDSKFTRGVVSWDVNGWGQKAIFPLQDLDIIMMVNWLSAFGDVLLHASAVVLDGKGYAFIGRSNQGKSTIAKIFQKNHKALVLGEDTVVLRYLDGQFWIFGTPWHVNPKMCSPQGFPLATLFSLSKGSGNRLELMQPAQAVASVLKTAFIPFYRTELLPGILDRLERLTHQIPVYELSYMLDQDPLQIIQNC